MRFAQRISDCGSNFQFASKALKNDKKIVLLAVSSHSFSLQFASEDLKNDIEMFLAAMPRDQQVQAWVRSATAAPDAAGARTRGRGPLLYTFRRPARSNGTRTKAGWWRDQSSVFFFMSIPFVVILESNEIWGGAHSGRPSGGFNHCEKVK